MILQPFHEILAAIFKRFNTDARSAIVLTIILIAIPLGVYQVIIVFYSPDLRLEEVWGKFFKNEFKFYSGNESGTYYKIGYSLENYNNSHWYSSDFNIKNERTSGGYINARNVLENSKTFGIIQECAIGKNDYIRQHIDFVAPLYSERMHIICNAECFRSRKDTSIIELSAYTDEKILKALLNTRIGVGNVGSGTIITSSLIMAEIEKQILQQKITNSSNFAFPFVECNLKDAIRKLRKDSIDIFFYMGGSPNKTINDSLLKENKKDFRFISISPSFVNSMNEVYKLNLRPDYYYKDEKNDRDNIGKNKKPDSLKAKSYYPIWKTKNISTFSSFAYLITDNKTLKVEKLHFLEKLQGLTQETDSSLNVNFMQAHPRASKIDSTKRDSLISYFNEIKLPLDEFKFLEIYNKSDKEEINKVAKAISLFFSSLIFSFLTLISAIIWALSSRKHHKISEKLKEANSSIYLSKTNIELNKIGLQKLINKLNKFHNDRVIRVNPWYYKLIRLRSKFIKKQYGIETNFQQGKIIETHYHSLLDQYNLLIKNLQRQFHLCLVEELQNKDKQNEIKNDKGTYEIKLLEYLKSRFLSYDDYKDLCLLVDKIA